jgi:hypothetical protein
MDDSILFEIIGICCFVTVILHCGRLEFDSFVIAG